MGSQAAHFFALLRVDRSNHFRDHKIRSVAEVSVLDREIGNRFGDEGNAGLQIVALGTLHSNFVALNRSLNLEIRVALVVLKPDVVARLVALDELGFLDKRFELATAGSVDDGKSTLIGRLLYDSKQVFEDTLASLERASAAQGLAFGHASRFKFTDFAVGGR